MQRRLVYCMEFPYTSKNADNIKTFQIAKKNEYLPNCLNMTIVHDSACNVTSGCRQSGTGEVTDAKCQAHDMDLVSKSMFGDIILKVKPNDDLEPVKDLYDNTKTLTEYSKTTTINRELDVSLKAVIETRFNTVAIHFESVLENVAPRDGNDILERKLAEKKKSTLLENIDNPLLKEVTRHLLQYQR